MSDPISCVVLSGTSSIPSWQISAGDAGTRTAIGSDPTVAWPFSASDVQPKHAELYYDGAALYVCDLVNMGDVRIGGSVVAAGQWVPVPIGSELEIGRARLSIQQGDASSFPAAKKQSSKQSKRTKKSSGVPPVRTLIIGGIALLAVLGAGGMFVFKKLQASQATAPPVIPSSTAQTGRSRSQSVDHLFPQGNTEIRTRDDFSKRTDPEAREKVEKKRAASGGSNLLERPEPSTIEGKAAAAAIDGDVTRAYKLYRELVNDNPSDPAFRVALELVEKQRAERCRQLGEGACD